MEDIKITSKELKKTSAKILDYLCDNYIITSIDNKDDYWNFNIKYIIEKEISILLTNNKIIKK